MIVVPLMVAVTIDAYSAHIVNLQFKSVICPLNSCHWSKDRTHSLSQYPASYARFDVRRKDIVIFWGIRIDFSNQLSAPRYKHCTSPAQGEDFRK